MYEEIVHQEMSSCKECGKQFHMPFDWCCLFECHEHEFCRNCDEGIYSEEFKKWIGKYER